MTTATQATDATDATQDAALAALRERQGAGARYDSADAPARELAWARLGTAYFARALADLADDELDAPSLVPGWSRRHVVAHVGYNARALTRLTEWAHTGTPTPMYRPGQRDAEIARGATLPPRALRNLISHAAVHLDVEWRDLTDEEWDRPVVTAQGRTVPVRETPWMRTREVWVHAVDLDHGASFLDLPRPVVDALLDDVLASWARRGETPDLVLEVTDREGPAATRTLGGAVAGAAPTVCGAAADLLRWLTGRGARRLVSSTPTLPDLPRWL